MLTAGTGKEGMEIANNLKGRRIDLIVTDVIMPQMGGREMVERIRPILPHAKVLFISGYTGDALARPGELEPGIVVLEKPFSPARLTCKIREVLDRPAEDCPDAANRGYRRP